jgi:hypothetical protein
MIGETMPCLGLSTVSTSKVVPRPSSRDCADSLPRLSLTGTARSAQLCKVTGMTSMFYGLNLDLHCSRCTDTSLLPLSLSTDRTQPRRRRTWTARSLLRTVYNS